MTAANENQTQPSVEQVYAAMQKVEAKLAELYDFYESEAAPLRRNLAKIHAWLWTNAPHTADSLTESYVAMRDKRTEIKAKYEAEDEDLKKRMEQHEIKLMEMLDAVGATSLRTAHGTAYKQEKVRSSCADWPTYWAWIVETGRFDGVEKRVGQKMITDLLKDGKDLPPGINVFREYEVTVRRS